MNRTFLLMAQFGAADVPLSRVVDAYFSHLSEATWKRRAALQEFPFPVFRAENSQKAPWMVSVVELARYLDGAEKATDWRQAG